MKRYKYHNFYWSEKRMKRVKKRLEVQGYKTMSSKRNKPMIHMLYKRKEVIK